MAIAAFCEKHLVMTLSAMISHSEVITTQTTILLTIRFRLSCYLGILLASRNIFITCNTCAHHSPKRLGGYAIYNMAGNNI